MRKLFTLFALATTTALAAQLGPGLIISEFLPNPSGTDSPYEQIELIATRTIDFSVTPYSVVVTNNSGTTQGWIQGGTTTYGFAITSGVVNSGDVVYVGGSLMVTSGVVLRSINTLTTTGDGFGSASSGPFGNGGSNADGVAVFDQPIAALTPATVPIDAVFCGSGPTTGSAVVNAGADGYQLPVNDLYAGGKLQSASFIAPDPGSGQYIVSTGAFNPVTGSFTTGRTWTATTVQSDMVSGITLGAVTSATLTFTGTHVQVSEGTTTVNVTVNVTGPNNGQIVYTIGAYPYSTATAGSDFIQRTDTVPAGTSGAQIVPITISEDLISEQDEYIAVRLTNLYNCTVSATAVYYIYIKDNDTPVPVASNELFLDSLSTFSNGAAGSNSAEIVAYDPAVQRLFIANSIAGKLDIVNFSNPASPTLITSINVSSLYGNINSVAAHDSVIALAIESTVSPQDSGKIVFLSYTGAFISQVKVGAMPDMITFNHAGTRVITVCEGEPNSTYTNDPDGCVASVNITGGVANVTQSNVGFITFTSFNGTETALRAQGIRIYGVSGMASKDFEPEYIAISDNDSIGWVTLQENNAIAKVDLITNTVIAVTPLGYKNYATGPAALDASDNNGTMINLMNAPVYGMYQPDAISQYTVNNQIYLITANEGDAREYGPVNEPVRASTLTWDPTVFPYAAQMKSNTFLGRLNVTNQTGDIDNDGDFDALYTFGGRSFSIWNGTTGSQVFDSGDNLERVTSTHPVYAPLFNMSNGTGTGTMKNRSDDKGPEPEGTAVGKINGDQFLFLCLERIGGVIMYNVNTPVAPSYVGYYNRRTVTGGLDRGAEGIIYIPDSLSPNGNDIVIVANEVSSTLSIFQVNTCAEKAGVAVTPASFDGCTGSSVTLTASTVAGTTYQWMMNGTNIPGATTPTYLANATGEYQVMITNTTHACSGKTEIVPVNIHAAPSVVASATSTTICNGSSTTLNVSGATTYNWMPGSLNGSSVSVSPVASETYTVTGTDAFGCTNTSTVAIVVNALPSVSASASLSSICNGSSTSLTGSGAATFTWMPGSLSGTTVSVSPTANETYTVTGTDGNGCTNTSTVAITVLTRPAVTASTPINQVCNGNSATLNGGGASTYNWMPGNLNGSSVTATITATTAFTVTGTAANGCTNTATVNVTMLPTPTVSATSSASSVCSGNSTTLQASGSGAANYIWFPGMLTGQNVSVIPSSSTTYTITGYHSNGCTHSSTVAITVNPSPVLTSGGLMSVCEGNSSTLTVSGASTYVWMPGALTGNSQTLNPASTTTYTIIGTGANSCTDSVNVTLTVNSNPTAALTVANDSACNVDGMINLSGSPSGGTYSGNSVAGNTFNPATAPIGSNQISYIYVDGNGCSDTALNTIVVDICLGINDAPLTSVNAYPNPFSDQLTITSSSTIERIDVYDAAGKLLMSEQQQSDKAELNMTGFVSGVYFIHVISDEGTSVITATRM